MTPDALPRFSLLVLALVVFGYFAARARRSPRARWLALALLGFSLHQAAFVVLDTASSETAFSIASGLTWSSAFLASWAFLGVALGFFADGLTPTGRRVMLGTGVVAVAAAVYAHLGYGPLLGTIPALSVQAVGGVTTMALMAATLAVLAQRARATGDGPDADRQRRAYRTFLAVIALGFVVPLTRALRDLGVVSAGLEGQLALVMWAVVMMGFVTLYVNYAPEPTSVVVKVVAFAFLSVVTALGVAAEVLFPAVDGSDPAAVAEARDRATAYAGLIVGAGAFVLAALPLLLRDGLTRPLQRLVAGVRRAAQGDLGAEVPVETRDEVGRLTEDFNRMTGALRTAEDTLRRYADELEDRVDERTAELAASLDELRATQARLVQQEKLASLGQLTAGIAHEIKNPLNFVTNFADLSVELVEEIRDEDDPGVQEEILTDLRANAEKIAEHGRRADAIVRGMMAHARGGGGAPETVDLDALVAEYAALAVHGFKARRPDVAVAFEQDLGGAGAVRAVPADLGRVVINLLDNAFDAVADGERVTVETRRVGDRAEIRVTDAGVGMAEAVRRKVFEPFFTTKPTGEGTGLGLSLAYDIVTQGHGGTLTADSTLGKGSTFTVSLPAS